MAHINRNLREEPNDRLIHVRLAAETHRRLRIKVADLDTSIQDWVADLIRFALERQPMDLALRKGRKP